MREASSFRERRGGGSTLAEVLISLGILVPLIIVVLGIFPYHHAINRRAQQLAAAHDLARAQLESLRCLAFDEIPARSELQETRAGTDYACLVESSPSGEPGDVVRLLQVTVTVSWRGTRSETLRLGSLVPRMGNS